MPDSPPAPHPPCWKWRHSEQSDRAQTSVPHTSTCTLHMNWLVGYDLAGAGRRLSIIFIIFCRSAGYNEECALAAPKAPKLHDVCSVRAKRLPPSSSSVHSVGATYMMGSHMYGHMCKHECCMYVCVCINIFVAIRDAAFLRAKYPQRAIVVRRDQRPALETPRFLCETFSENAPHSTHRYNSYSVSQYPHARS